MTISPSYPNILLNGTTADATQVMADFFQIQNDVNANAAHNGANNDITSLTGLTTPLGAAFGGTGTTTGFASPAFTGTPTAPTAANGTNTTQIATTAFALANGAPLGSILLWTTNTSPANFLECDGSAVSRTTYASLFVLIGSTFGSGDGATTFNLPDMRGQFARGWDHGRGVDPARTFGTTQAGAFASHTHTAVVTDPSHVHNYIHKTNVGGSTAGGDPQSVVDNNFNTGNSLTGITVTNQSTGGTETRPTNVALMYIIKVI